VLHSLGELDIVDEVLATTDTLCEEDVARGSDSDNVRVFTERLEGDRIMNLPGGLPGVMQCDEVGRGQWILGHRVGVVMLSA
jgi:hypothetical protein